MKLEIKSERQIYHTLMVLPETKERLKKKCEKAKKTMVEYLDDFSKIPS